MANKERILAALEFGKAELIDGIRHIFNCREADVDNDGDIWIAGPMRGHWLDEDGIARIERALELGDI